MPLKPISASPRATLWSIESKRTLTNSGARPSPLATSDLYVEADEAIGARGIGFDERRAAFRVAGPAERALLRADAGWRRYSRGEPT